MINLKFYIVSYDECRDMVVNNLFEDELKKVYCYAVNEKYQKRITNKISTIYEWKLPWFDADFQNLQYCEYSLIAHCAKNKSLTENLSHIGLFHFDTVFKKNSINDIELELNKNPNQIFYMHFQTDKRSIYLNREQLNNVCMYMSEKLKIFINSEIIWNGGFISHSMSIAPVHVFEKFGNFMVENHKNIEDIIRNNRWGIMNTANHRTCGLVERMWGFYLVSLGIPLKKINNIIHDGSSYKHAAWEEDLKNKITNK